MTTRELFDFVTRYTLQEEEYESYIEKVETVLGFFPSLLLIPWK